MTPAAIEARGVEKRFGRAVALRGIDLRVEQGSSLAILGPNGAGKSTLLGIMAGLARPTSGSLEVCGERANRPSARARVGYIGHATFLYPELTARENLLFAARLHGVRDPRARVEALLEEEGLLAIAQRPTGGFSRGMAQRVAIARGLVHDPSVLLLDEPFTGLDRPAAERLAKQLGRLRGDGRTLVLVTHDVELAPTLADAAIVLSNGRVVHRAGGGPLDVDGLERAYLAATDPMGRAG